MQIQNIRYFSKSLHCVKGLSHHQAAETVSATAISRGRIILWFTGLIWAGTLALVPAMAEAQRRVRPRARNQT